MRSSEPSLGHGSPAFPSRLPPTRVSPWERRCPSLSLKPSSVLEGGEPKPSFLKTVQRVCISENWGSDSTPAFQLLVLTRGFGRAGLCPQGPLGRVRRPREGSGPALTSQPAAAGPWSWLSVVQGSGWPRVSPSQAQAEFTSHFPPVTLQLGCGLRSPQEPPLGGSAPASLSWRGGSSFMLSGSSQWPTLPLPRLQAALQLGKRTPSNTRFAGAH